MRSASISREAILRSTLFHIQIKQCQYIDDFPENVTSVFHEMIKSKQMRDFEQVKKRLYRISTSFFAINKERVCKKEFYEGLYKRVSTIKR